MVSLAKPWLAKSTILARMTSRYGDVYSRDRLTSSQRSSSERLMTNGLLRGIWHLRRRRHCLISASKRLRKIRHHICEWEHLVSARREPSHERVAVAGVCESHECHRLVGTPGAALDDEAGVSRRGFQRGRGGGVRGGWAGLVLRWPPLGARPGPP